MSPILRGACDPLNYAPHFLDNLMQIALAPMEGLVDDILRDVLTRIGGIDWCVTEFIRVSERLLPAAS